MHMQRCTDDTQGGHVCTVSTSERGFIKCGEFPIAVSSPNMYDKGSIVIYVKNILINELCKFCYKIWSNSKKDTPT